MTSYPAAELSHAVNIEARRQYPQIAKLLGMSSLLTTVAPRLALRQETPYPYSFTEDDAMLPSNTETFGRVIKRDRQSGLQEIHASLSSQRQEHQWLYIPQATLWLDTTTEANETTVESDQYAHIFLSHVFPTIEAVHTHPDETVKNLAQDCPWNYSENYLLEAAQPSPSDLIGHYQMARRSSLDSRQISTVVSHHGVTSFELNDAGNRAETFRTGQYDRLIDNPTDHAHAIRGVLAAMRQHVTNFEGEPLIDVSFSPMAPQG